MLKEKKVIRKNYLTDTGQFSLNAMAESTKVVRVAIEKIM